MVHNLVSEGVVASNFGTCHNLVLTSDGEHWRSLLISDSPLLRRKVNADVVIMLAPAFLMIPRELQEVTSTLRILQQQ